MSALSWDSREDLKACRYLFSYWRLHPDNWDSLNGAENTTEFRCAVFEEINAVTDGDLERLIPEGPLSPHWVAVFGLAVQAYWKMHP